MVDTRRFRVLAARAALVVLLFAGAAACGDDDDTVDETGDKGTAATGGDQAAGGDTEAFCAGLVEFNAAANETELDEESTPEDVKAVGERLAPLWAQVADNAPEAVSAQVAELTPVIDALGEGDGGPFNEDATFETYTEVVSGGVGECGFEEVKAEAIDYAFQGLPTDVPAGTVALSIENKSAAGEMHEMILFKKADGETRPALELLNDPALEEQGPGEFAGATFAPAGQSGAGLADLTAGDYVAVCFISVGSQDVPEGEEGDGPPHFTQGMVAEFTVS